MGQYFLWFSIVCGVGIIWFLDGFGFRFGGFGRLADFCCVGRIGACRLVLVDLALLGWLRVAGFRAGGLRFLWVDIIWFLGDFWVLGWQGCWGLAIGY